MPLTTSSAAAANAITNGVINENVDPALNPKAATAFPPPKTDKPRPHICATCTRSFARLEHLKRHERSHTKEKPFECSECTRCFARRDLLLRHQQKLHMTTTPSSRPRNRRESASSTATSSKIRKGSVAKGPGAMRPRANTISHVDNAAIHLIAPNSANPRNIVQGGHSRHGSLMGLSAHDSYHLAGMSAALGHRGMSHNGLPKLDMDNVNTATMGGGLRTAPVDPRILAEFDWDMFNCEGSTVNPNALHYSDSPQSMAIDSASAYQHAFPDMSGAQPMEENFDWMNGFEHQLDFTANENAIDGSSPSAISTASQSGISEVMLDGSNQPVNPGSMWQQSMMAPALMAAPGNFNFDLSLNGFPDFLHSGAPISPHNLSQKQATDTYFSTPPPSMSSLSPSMMPGLTNTNGIHHTMNFGPETPSSVNGVNQQYSPAATITEATRQVLVAALNQITPFGGRKNSFQFSAPANFRGQPNENARSLPSTADLQRYVGAYITYFQPHLPFLHLPTLSFDVPASQINSARQSGMVGGRGCLMLSMAAIGALYEMDHAVSREIFELAKKMIQLYLEERRKADVRKADMRKAGVADSGHATAENSVHTPVWLVQAMLLNVIYGHNCGDKTAGDIAATHCAALVSLSRAAGLLRPPNGTHPDDLTTADDTPMADMWLNGSIQDMTDEQREWIKWRITEERKRTLFTVFALSSLLVSAFNHTPALTNSEILLELPCEEDFWACDSAASFNAKGGVKAASQNLMLFHDALGELLRTSEKQHMQNGYSNGTPSTSIKPSTFGCFVLINALHNYIWETRQRHHNKLWTNEETEKMHRHIEPALKAWQEAWASNPSHSLERPDPFGFGAFSADSIPLLDLAYVRLFVNLSRSKEKFWQRDYEGMAEEISRGSEMVQHAEHSPNSNVDSSAASDPASEVASLSGGGGGSAHSHFGDTPPSSGGSPGFAKAMAVGGGVGMNGGMQQQQQQQGNTSAPPQQQTSTAPGTTSKRERHLRKAAFYAADSLSMSDKLGVTFADFTSRELPLQSAMCAFDCAQVLAEWVATVQERVGAYLGILGRDEVDYSQVPGIMLLEEEDIKLLIKIQEVLQSAEMKMNYEAGMQGMQGLAMQQRSLAEEPGFGARILRITGFMLDKAAVWPMTHLMARSLETQASHMRARAEASVMQRV
ncbi:hypothetical protein V494_02625 [Pseudogymnoascus sp. VKM F-4513 (FW-928)]|nr:hypothetical protein V494_02625 [Pseudogymnoascus sp. VKM F-4513 (FW-928)]